MYVIQKCSREECPFSCVIKLGMIYRKIKPSMKIAGSSFPTLYRSKSLPDFPVSFFYFFGGVNYDSMFPFVFRIGNYFLSFSYNVHNNISGLPPK